MPTSTRDILLGRYHYDPLDRLVDCTPFGQAAIQRYYCKTRLSTELQGAVQRTIVQHDNQLLAQQQCEGVKMTTTLLAPDQQRSVLNALVANQLHPLAYAPYGHRSPENGLLSLLGFTGERPDAVTGHYHLGNGYRQFSPGLMRFTSPDSWSPFGEGGLNAYAYCAGDPVNKIDPNGHAALGLFLIAGGIGSIVGAGIVIAKGKGETESVIGGVALGILGLSLMVGGGHLSAAI
jgi:RHS repeat-associated protein